MGPDSQIVVYVDILGELTFARTAVFTWRFWRVKEELDLVIPPEVGRIMARTHKNSKNKTMILHTVGVGAGRSFGRLGSRGARKSLGLNPKP